MFNHVAEKITVLKKIILVLLAGLVTLGFQPTDKLVTLNTRPGVTQKIMFIMPREPLAGAIMFPGGHGNLGLSSSDHGITMQWGKNNFVVRMKEEFVKDGLMVAVIDIPSDRPKMNAIFRMGGEHIQDIRAVVEEMKKRADIPIWLVGTSMGTFSACNGAIHIKNKIHGLVLTSSVTRSSKKWKIYRSHPNGVINMRLDRVTVPTLIVAHRDDQCPHTPAIDAPKLKNRFINVPKVEVKYFVGGLPPQSGPCKALSAHGFLGVEKEVVAAIGQFIKTN